MRRFFCRSSCRERWQTVHTVSWCLERQCRAAFYNLLQNVRNHEIHQCLKPEYTRRWVDKSLSASSWRRRGRQLGRNVPSVKNATWLSCSNSDTAKIASWNILIYGAHIINPSSSSSAGWRRWPNVKTRCEEKNFKIRDTKVWFVNPNKLAVSSCFLG